MQFNLIILIRATDAGRVITTLLVGRGIILLIHARMTPRMADNATTSNMAIEVLLFRSFLAELSLRYVPMKLLILKEHTKGKPSLPRLMKTFSESRTRWSSPRVPM